MTRDDVFKQCLAMPGAVEDYPFGEEVAVFKVGGKMFAIVEVTGKPGHVTLKCDPGWAVELREKHRSITAGYHTNKRHWNTVELDGSLKDDLVRDMVGHSYELVVSGLTRAQRAELPEA